MTAVRTLPEALARAARGPEGFVFAVSDTESYRSYAEIHDVSSRVAAGLRAIGLGSTDVAALILADPEQFLTALFGAAIAGVIPASLYPPTTLSRLEGYVAATSRTLRSAGARAVVTSASLVPLLEEMRATCPELRVVVSVEALAGLVSARPTNGPVIGLDDVALVQFTSGSTSAPKGIVISHRSLSANIDAINGPHGLASSSEDVAVSWLPLYHDMGLVGMALGALYCGRPAVLLSPERFVKRPADWLRAISRHRGTISFAPNFAYDLCVRRIKARDLEGVDLSHWRVAGCGGEPIHSRTLEAFAERFARAGFRSTSFVPSYGLAEHVVAATLSRRGRPVRVDRLSAEDLAVRAAAVPSETSDGVSVVSCGAPLTAHRLRIVDRNGREVAERTVGEIVLAGPSVMDGYLGDEESTVETLRDGWLHTGDLGYMADGELFVCGRIKDLIIVNGRKFHPQDLEWTVDDLEGIRRGRVVAFAAASVDAADRVVMVVEPSGILPADVLVENIRRRVADSCGLYVEEVMLVSGGTIGRTTSGKVQRVAVREQYRRGELTCV